METMIRKLSLTLRMIKVQHSVFALPFALSAVFVATNGNPPVFRLVMIVLALFTARNAAMTFNRIVDQKLDKDNPRTAAREIPSGKLSQRFAIVFCLTNCILFVLISSYFNKLTLILSPVALFIILGYSLTKRFTDYTHVFLGLALGIAPIAAWIAMTGELALFPLMLGLAVLCWVAGFDIIYSTLDYDYDRQKGMRNLVVKFGIRDALFISRLLHIFAIGFLILGGIFSGLSLFYFIGCLICAVLLFYEQSLVKPTDLSRVNMAFFAMNGYVSLAFFVFVLADIYV